MKKVFCSFVFALAVCAFGKETKLGSGYVVITTEGEIPHAQWNITLIYKKGFLSKKTIWPSLTAAPGGAQEFVKDDIAIFPAGVPKTKMFGMDPLIGASLHGSNACLITYQLPHSPDKIDISDENFATEYKFFGYKKTQEGLWVTYYRVAIQSSLPEQYKIFVTWEMLRDVINGIIQHHDIKELEGVKYLVPKEETGK